MELLNYQCIYNMNNAQLGTNLQFALQNLPGRTTMSKINWVVNVDNMLEVYVSFPVTKNIQRN